MSSEITLQGQNGVRWVLSHPGNIAECWLCQAVLLYAQRMQEDGNVQ